LNNFPDDRQTAETALLLARLIMHQLRELTYWPRRCCGARWNPVCRWHLAVLSRELLTSSTCALSIALAQRGVCAIREHPNQPAFFDRSSLPDRFTNNISRCTELPEDNPFSEEFDFA
jgi:hypothetical protein